MVKAIIGSNFFRSVFWALLLVDNLVCSLPQDTSNKSLDRRTLYRNSNIVPKVLINEGTFVELHKPLVTYYNDRYSQDLHEVLSVHRARLIDAPPGYGCFFISYDGGDLVSETFYSISPISIDASSLFGKTLMSSVFPSAGGITCFVHSDPLDGNQRTGTFLELDNGSMDNVEDDNDRKYDFTFFSLSGYYLFPEGPSTLHRAAIVHQGHANTVCSAFTDLVSEPGKNVEFTGERVRFTADEPLNTPVKGVIGIECE